MSFEFISGLTGGISYHFSAVRYRRQLWRPYLNEVRAWLHDEWCPRNSELIVFGPSAGWTLPLDFLVRFQKVVAIEPDPVARWILRRRLRTFAPRLEFQTLDRSDLLPWFREGTLEALIERNPRAAILFANLLGQIPLLKPPRPSAPARAEFLAALRGRSWASYHDLISAKLDAHTTFSPTSVPLTALARADLDLERLVETALSPARDAFDHETLWLSDARQTRLTHWQLRPDQRHVIAFVHSHPDSP